MNPIAEQALAKARKILSPGASSKAPTRKFWTPSDEQRFAELYGDTPMPELIEIFGRPDHAIYGKAASMGLKRSEAYLASEHACRLRRENNPGVEFRFQKGQKPWNTGIKGLPSTGRMPETQFKKGSKPRNWLPIGSLRLSKEGYQQRKVTDTGYPPRDWVSVHTLLWEEHHGPVPSGHCLCFRDGNKQNIELANLELITRAERMRRNTFHRFPPELKDTIRQLNKLKRAISEASDEKQND